MFGDVLTSIAHPVKVLAFIKRRLLIARPSHRDKPQNSDSFQPQRRERHPVQPLIQREQAIAADVGMGAYQEVGKNAARTVIALLAAPFRIGLKCPASRPPNWLIQVPIDCDSVFVQQRTRSEE